MCNSVFCYVRILSPIKALVSSTGPSSNESENRNKGRSLSYAYRVSRRFHFTSLCAKSHVSLQSYMLQSRKDQYEKDWDELMCYCVLSVKVNSEKYKKRISGKPLCLSVSQWCGTNSINDSCAALICACLLLIGTLKYRKNENVLYIWTRKDFWASIMSFSIYIYFQINLRV